MADEHVAARAEGYRDAGVFRETISRGERAPLAWQWHGKARCPRREGKGDDEERAPKFHRAAEDYPPPEGFCNQKRGVCG